LIHRCLHHSYCQPLTLQKWKTKLSITNLAELFYYTIICHWSNYKNFILWSGELHWLSLNSEATIFNCTFFIQRIHIEWRIINVVNGTIKDIKLQSICQPYQFFKWCWIFQTSTLNQGMKVLLCSINTYFFGYLGLFAFIMGL